jgi:tRNA threonylcarbamoyladenosine biosynthesis protein TsaB
MTVLGIDTATMAASVALAEDGTLVGEAIQASGAEGGSYGASAQRPNHAEVILPLIERLLTTSHRSLADLSAIAVSIGPGTFTGLRIGLSTVKGLAYGWQMPVVGVPTLLAVAARVTDWEGLICPLLDARKNQIYGALFQRRAGALERLAEDRVCALEPIVRQIRAIQGSDACLFIGDGTRAYGAGLKGAMGDSALLRSGEGYPSTAFAVASLGEQRLRAGDTEPLGPLVPLYLRPPEAEIKGHFVRDKS